VLKAERDLLQIAVKCQAVREAKLTAERKEIFEERDRYRTALEFIANTPAGTIGSLAVHVAEKALLTTNGPSTEKNDWCRNCGSVLANKDGKSWPSCDSCS
jgi:hypothetical protein